MTAEEISKISSSCGYIGNIIPWYAVSQNFSGDVILYHDFDLHICKAIGQCKENTCDCFYSSHHEGHSCKNKVDDCYVCVNAQNCTTNEQGSFCSCDNGFEGRICEYDINECVENNGDCEYICVNVVGSYHCECPNHLLLADDGKTCHEPHYCVQGSQKFLNGKSWLKDCQVCNCEHGIATCKDVCIETSCLPEETLIHFPGYCCPECVKLSYCMIYYNAIYPFGDRRGHDMSGISNYTVIEDCIGGQFKLRMEFPSTQRNLVIYQDCEKLTVTSNGRVYFGDIVKDLPLENDLWSVDVVNGSVVIITATQLSVKWDLTNRVTIALPDSRIHEICGFCNPDWYENKNNNSNWWAVARLLENEIISEHFYSNLKNRSP